MKPFEIKPNVYWTGALHPDLRIFDIIMQTKNGTTYNSYLIRDDKVAVIDTVKEKYSEPYLDHLAGLTPLEQIDYIIVQHTEPDHSGSLDALLKAAPNATVVCSKGAVKYVQNTLNRDVDLKPVKNGETLSLGEKELQFVVQPNVHWPDTMMTYLSSDNILFPCDVFGAHFCDSLMFNDDITRDFWPDFKYYFDMIMRPFKKNVRSALEKIEPLAIDMIAPSHGPVLREHPHKYIEAYQEWAAPLPENNPRKICLYFTAAHGSTAKMAEAIAEGIREAGAETELFDALELKIPDHFDRLEQADAILFGSPTINNDAAKPVWDIINSMTTLDTKGKIVGSFGSFGWSGEAVPFMDERLKNLKFKVPFEGLKVNLVPSLDDLAACREFGADIAQAVQ